MISCVMRPHLLGTWTCHPGEDRHTVREPIQLVGQWSPTHGLLNCTATSCSMKHSSHSTHTGDSAHHYTAGAKQSDSTLDTNELAEKCFEAIARLDVPEGNNSP